MRQVKKYLKNLPSNLSGVLYKKRAPEKVVKRRAPAVKKPESVGSKKSDGDENEDRMCPPSRKLRRAAELYSYTKAS